MARQRFIWPSIWKDPVFGRLQPVEQMLFVGLFSIADDDGRLLADPAYLRSELFAYKEWSNKKVQSVRDSVCEKCANVHLYEFEGLEYIALLKWHEYQRPKYPKPSKLPPPEGQDSPKLPPGVEESSPKASPQGWVGLDRNGLGRAGLGPPAEETASDFKIPDKILKSVEDVA